MPSASLQSRISAFEALESTNNGHTKSNGHGSVQLAPLSVPRKPVPQQHSFLDTDSTSPTADSLFAIPPIQPVPSPSRPSSPAALGRKSSLIDFSELASPQLKPVSVNGTGSTTSSTSASSSSTRPHLPPRASPRIPPLPPRKPSVTSLKTTPTTAPPPLPKRHASSPVTVSKQPSSPSLLIPSDHTYPPASPRRGVSPGLPSRHIPSSSTSSFHSVSLSSDGGGDARDSLDGSYEAVSSSTAATSPASTEHDWEHDLQPTPKLPQRPWQKQAASSPIPSPQPATRRPAPPPPQRRPVKYDSPAPASLPHLRPTPLPLSARKRYDALFERNLPQTSRKGRTSSGWRGISVDLLTNGEKPDFGNETRREDVLEGVVVKQIWSCSKLPRARLREIWSECDPDSVGSLDRDAFARGMWRIDEELSRVQQQNPAPRLPPKPMSSSYSHRVPPPPLRKPNFPLR